MAGVHSRERELKFEAGQHTSLPDLSGISGVAEVAEPVDIHLHATYFDTEGLHLIRSRVTLRHRTGGSDEGWHLKLPEVKGARTEIQLPLSPLAEGPPQELLDLIRVHLRDRAVMPVAEILNNRRVWRLADASGSVLAEVTDDDVTARSLREGREHTSRWREWEAELVTGGEDLLGEIRDRLLSAGAQDSPIPSKLARALGPLPETTTQATTFRGHTAGALVHAALTKHVATFTAYDPRVRAAEEDSVHQMRVAARRIRSILRAYSHVLDNDAVRPIESELKWAARVLGDARDAEVMADRLRALIDQQPEGTIPENVRDRLLGGQQEAYDKAYAVVTEMLNGTRYFRLLDALDTLRGPSVVAHADLAADDAVKRAVERVFDKASKTEEAARDEADSAERDELLHSLRKASKRVRYAAELASRKHNSKPVRKRVKRVRKAAETLQETLGEHQDGVITRALLDETARGSAAKEAEALARLARHEQELADAAAENYHRDWLHLVHEMDRLRQET